MKTNIFLALLLVATSFIAGRYCYPNTQAPTAKQCSDVYPTYQTVPTKGEYHGPTHHWM